MGFYYQPPPAQQIFAIETIRETGFLGHNAYWDNLRDAREKNPTQFDKHHELLAPLLRRDELQTDPFEDVLGEGKKHKKWERRFHKAPKNFSKYHSGWMVSLIKLDDELDNKFTIIPPVVIPPVCPEPPKDPNPICTGIFCPPEKPPVCPPQAVPEPASGLMLGLSLIGAAVFKRFRS